MFNKCLYFVWYNSTVLRCFLNLRLLCFGRRIFGWCFSLPIWRKICKQNICFCFHYHGFQKWVSTWLLALNKNWGVLGKQLGIDVACLSLPRKQQSVRRRPLGWHHIHRWPQNFSLNPCWKTLSSLSGLHCQPVDIILQQLHGEIKALMNWILMMQLLLCWNAFARFFVRLRLRWSVSAGCALLISPPINQPPPLCPLPPAPLLCPLCPCPPPPPLPPPPVPPPL